MPNTIITKVRVLKASIPRPKRNLPMARTAVQKTSSEIPMKTPAVVNPPIRHAFGVGEGRTLSVVNDIPSRSPVSMMITISIGVKIACPVMTRPTAKNSA